MSDREMATVLRGVTRLRNTYTVNGNPRFTVHTDDGDFTISSDSSCSYDVENVDADRRRAGGAIAIRLTLTRANRFYRIAVAR